MNRDLMYNKPDAPFTMKKYIFFASIVFLFLQPALATFPDSASFNNSLEKECFTDFQNGKRTDLMKFFMSYNYSEFLYAKTSLDFNNLIENLKTATQKLKPSKKQLQFIYKTVHDSYFKKYNEKALFNDIFLSGEYNCLTATALYSITLEKLGIQHEIRETDNHVYLVATLDNQQFIIETTMPQKGVIPMNMKLTKAHIQHLVKNKIISEIEYQQKSHVELFSDFFLKAKVINQTELIALHYYNMSVFKSQDTKYEEAMKEIDKAVYLYPSTTIKNITKELYQQVLYEYSLQKKFNGTTLARFMKYHTNPLEAVEYSINYYKLAADEHIIRNHQPEKFIEFNKAFQLSVNDSLDISEVTKLYYYFIGYAHAINSKYPESLKSLKLAHEIKKEDMLVRQLIQESLSKHIMFINQNSTIIDTLDYYFKAFPFLTENINIQRTYTYACLRMAYDSYYFNNLKAGDYYLDLFRQSVNERKFALQENDTEGTLYDLAILFYNNRKHAKAKATVLEALKWIPESTALRQLHSDFQKNSNQPTGNFVMVEIPEQAEMYLNFGQFFKKKFQKFWRAETIIKGSSAERYPIDKTFQINAGNNQRVEYSYRGKSEKGSWSLREKSKLLCLVPDGRKNDYIMFKVIEISDKELLIQPFIDNKKLSPETIILKAMN